jgi:hypothetical protein
MMGTKRHLDAVTAATWDGWSGRTPINPKTSRAPGRHPSRPGPPKARLRATLGGDGVAARAGERELVDRVREPAVNAVEPDDLARVLGDVAGDVAREDADNAATLVEDRVAVGSEVPVRVVVFGKLLHMGNVWRGETRVEFWQGRPNSGGNDDERRK